MKALLFVFIGGGLGSSLRFLIGKRLNAEPTDFPWGTFTVNLLGSLIIGLIFGYLLERSRISDETLWFLAAGFCGGFTTFSAFAYESISLLKAGEIALFLTYVIGSVLAGLVCVWMGYSLVRLM